MKENSILAIFKGKSKKPIPGQGSKAKPAPVEKPAKGNWANPKPVFKAAEQSKVTAMVDKDKMAIKELKLILSSDKTAREKNRAIIEALKKHQSTK